MADLDRILGEIASLEMGQSPPSEVVHDGLGGGLPFLQGNAEFTSLHPQPRQSCSQPQKTCHSGDALISVRAPVGAINVADRAYCIGRGLAAVQFRQADAKFGAYALRHAAPQLQRVAQGTTFAAVGRKELQKLRLWTPPLPEQRQIAEVLDTVDEAIRKTEQIIAKLKQVKQGLLHDLLTRGIDDNGELRDPNRHPDQFKDSPLGRIPKAWATDRVESLLAPVNPAMRSGPFGSALLKHELVEDGIPLLGIDNVHVERFVANYTRFVTPGKAAELSRYLVRPKDVMITIMGTVGRCCVVPDEIGAALSSKHVWTLTFDRERYSPLLACLQFNHAPWMLRHFAKDEQGGIMSAIRSDTLRSAILPVPPMSEATKMESVLATHSERIDRAKDSVAKLRQLKNGLMEDLLTGRVRVLPLLEDAAE